MASEKKIGFLAGKYAKAFAAGVADGTVEPLGATESLVVRFSRIAQEDPTAKGKHAEALIRWHCAGHLPLSALTSPAAVATEEMSPVVSGEAPEEGVRADLEMIELAKGRLPEGQRNVLAMSGPKELHVAAAALEALLDDGLGRSGKAEAKTEAEMMASWPHAKILAEAAGALVVEVRTPAAAAWWGRGTRWCTAGRSGSFAESYLRSGPLFVATKPNGAKYQWSARAMVQDAADSFADPFDVLAQIPAILRAPAALAALLASSNEKGLASLAEGLLATLHPDRALLSPSARRRAAAEGFRGFRASDVRPSALEREIAFDGGNGLYGDLDPQSRTLPRTLRMVFDEAQDKVLQNFKLSVPASQRAAVLEAIHRHHLSQMVRNAPKMFATDVDLSALVVRRSTDSWSALPAEVRLHPEVIGALLGADLACVGAVLADAASRGRRSAARTTLLVEKIVKAAVEANARNALDLPAALAHRLSAPRHPAPPTPIEVQSPAATPAAGHRLLPRGWRRQPAVASVPCGRSAPPVLAWCAAACAATLLFAVQTTTEEDLRSMPFATAFVAVGSVLAVAGAIKQLRKK